MRTRTRTAAKDGGECIDRPKAGLLHGDNDVDLDDLSVFLGCWGGSAVPVNPACAN
jgi:hypothetical protein